MGRCCFRNAQVGDTTPRHRAAVMGPNACAQWSGSGVPPTVPDRDLALPDGVPTCGGRPPLAFTAGPGGQESWSTVPSRRPPLEVRPAWRAADASVPRNAAGRSPRSNLNAEAAGWARAAIAGMPWEER